MVKITNGARTTVVTLGAFNDLYKPMGWKICGKSKEKPSAEEITADDKKPAETSPEMANSETEDTPDEADEVAEEDIEVEMPLSEMKIEELKAYAEEHNIDISAAKTKKDMMDIIKAEMEA